MTKSNCTAKQVRIIQIDEEQVKNHLGKIVRGTVQETLNALLHEEAERFCRTKRYERTCNRSTCRFILNASIIYNALYLYIKMKLSPILYSVTFVNSFLLFSLRYLRIGKYSSYTLPYGNIM
jgi:hypothetical protein